jgi:hypothetical protein
MSRSQLLLLIISWLTVASAGYVAGEATAVSKRPVAEKGIQAGCASALVPDALPALEFSTSIQHGRPPVVSE